VTARPNRCALQPLGLRFTLALWSGSVLAVFTGWHCGGVLQHVLAQQ
jgi:hypothetical protein